MLDRPHRQGPLDQQLQFGDFGAHSDSDSGTAPGVIIETRPDLLILEIAGIEPPDDEAQQCFRRATGLELPLRPGSATSNGNLAVLWLSPGRWQIAAAPREGGIAAGPLQVALGGVFFVTDLSHGQSALRIRGARVYDTLERCVPIDLHPSVFRPNACARTLVGEIGLLLHLVDQTPTIDLYVERSLAVAFWRCLTTAAAPFGYRVEAFQSPSQGDSPAQFEPLSASAEAAGR